MEDYRSWKPADVRRKIRDGEITGPTAGMCGGYAQANLVILPKDYAEDFKEFARKNPKPCPILEIVEGTPDHVAAVINALTKQAQSQGLLTAVIAADEHAHKMRNDQSDPAYHAGGSRAGGSVGRARRSHARP